MIQEGRRARPKMEREEIVDNENHLLINCNNPVTRKKGQGEICFDF